MPPAELLLLAHRIPYPPDKGDKIRAYHLLRFLARRFQVHLGAFIDDPRDLEHQQTVADLAGGETLFRPLSPRSAKLKAAISGLIHHQPLTLPYFHDPALSRWVSDLLARRPIRLIVAYSSAMAPYVMTAPQPKICDMVDVDSAKWAQYAERHHGGLRWLHGREARLLARVEEDIAGQFDATFLVTPREADLLRVRAPRGGERIGHWRNGVDTAYFDPGLPFPSPYLPGEKVLVFTGVMDYWANEEGVAWFAREVFPRVVAEEPAARFVIVGRNPSRGVQRLATLPGVRVTGAVPDVRPYLSHAMAAVAPLRVGQGVQNKVLEAMAMAKPVLATPKAMAGLSPPPHLLTRTSDETGILVRHALELLALPDPFLGRLGRAWVVEHGDWERNLAPLGQLLDELASLP